MEMIKDKLILINYKYYKYLLFLFNLKKYTYYLVYLSKHLDLQKILQRIFEKR